MQTPQIRILVADDHAVVVDGLRLQFQEQPDMVIVATADSFAATRQALAIHAVDVVVLDMAGMGGSPFHLMARLTRDYPTVAIVIFSSAVDLAPDMLAAGARGYVAKEDQRGALLQAIRTAVTGMTFISRTVQAYVDRCNGRTKPLSPREFLVLKLLAEGLEDSAIAEQMTIDQRTVQNYITTLRHRTGCHTRTQLMDWYRRMYYEPSLEAAATP
jgi:DNA-binding NarL/FixJ family response regulator